MSEIIHKQLYLGNILNVNRLQWLNQHNIQTIVCVASKDDVHIKDEIRAMKTVHQFEIVDHHHQTLAFDPIIQLIDASLQKGAVLVNCAVGISRSPAFVIAYLMKTQKLSLNDAYRIVKRARPKIGPNEGFMSQLMVYEQSISYEKMI